MFNNYNPNQMNNFNPNSFISSSGMAGGMRNGLLGGTSPFKTPQIKSATRLASKSSLGAVKKLSLTSILDTSTKAINTFNSFIPIYHEIKPLVANTKEITSTLKKAFSKTKKTAEKVRNEDIEVVVPEIVEPKKQEEVKVEFVDQKEPNKPFFG